MCEIHPFLPNKERINDRTALLAQTDGGVVDVVVGGNHAQIEWCYVHLILYADALGLLQVM